MELFKKNLVFREMVAVNDGGGGGGAGGNSIDIEQNLVTAKAEAIRQETANLKAAFTTAESAVNQALGTFDSGDSNKATLTKVLTNGTTDITDAIKTINEFADRMTESTTLWTNAEKELEDALAAAAATITN